MLWKLIEQGWNSGELLVFRKKKKWIKNSLTWQICYLETSLWRNQVDLQILYQHLHWSEIFPMSPFHPELSKMKKQLLLMYSSDKKGISTTYYCMMPKFRNVILTVVQYLQLRSANSAGQNKSFTCIYEIYHSNTLFISFITLKV